MSTLATTLSDYERWSASPSTAKQEAADYARWIAAVPAKHRELVRAWVASCSAGGRRLGWETYAEHNVLTDEDDAHAVAQLVRSAKAAKRFRDEVTPFDEPHV